MQLATPTSAPLKQPTPVPVPPGAWAALDRAAGNASAHEVLVRRTGSAVDGLDIKLVHERSLK
jgi:hypothetical protein